MKRFGRATVDMAARITGVVLMACHPGGATLPTDDAPVAPTAVTGATAETATPTAETGGTAPTGTTADTSDPCATLCDDGLDCSLDTCDTLGRCIHEPIEDCDWPAVAPEYAVSLSDLDPDGDLRISMSGAVWVEQAQVLWLLRNSGPEGVWRVEPDGLGGFEITGEWIDLGPQLDIEGITVVDPAVPHVVHVVEEGNANIVSFDLSVPGVSTEVGRWDISSWAPPQKALGAEGITFVPDAVLADQGFVDGDGNPRVSAGGMGGLMFVGHQAGGQVYVFDLWPIGIVDPVGTYDTARGDTSGLELDAETGRLYMWHGNTNDLEVARLSSTDIGGTNRKLDTEYVFDQTSPGNQEGIAWTGVCAGGVRGLVVVTDDGAERSVLVYPDWPIGCP
jgi:hypothetical protein